MAINRRKRSQIIRSIITAGCGALLLLSAVRIFSSPAEYGDDSSESAFSKDTIGTSLGKKIDWHDYELIKVESKRTGPGEQGKSVVLDPKEVEGGGSLFSANGFSALASDKIALDRTIKDIRHKDCKAKIYYERLPSVSVIVPFHNEHWTTLLRTAKTVLVRSPPKLIKEIILVDDFSTKEFLKSKLDEYVAENLPKTRIVRAEKREGLIRARLLGAKAARGAILIFLDSHSEVNTNWLPPLIEPIALNYRNVTCPFIDVIDFNNFEYRAQDEGARGAFDWQFFYKRLPLLEEDLKHPADPFKSPVMAGGLFAISSKFFWELGGYDPGLDVWGGEQYELSFKIWQCGGAMYDIPCSRIGHIYRKFSPFGGAGVGDYVSRNYRRVAQVWMDEYAEFIYDHKPHYRTLDAGDISRQVALRKKLRCKSFKWFMTEVAFDLVDHYPPVEPPDYATGEIRNVASNKCVDTRFKNENQRFMLENCLKDNSEHGGEQSFALTWHKDIRPKNRLVCFDVASSEPKASVVLFTCHNLKGNQLWRYVPDKKQLFHPISGNCMDCDPERREIFMSKCDTTKESQQWQFEKYNSTLLATLH